MHIDRDTDLFTIARYGIDTPPVFNRRAPGGSGHGETLVPDPYFGDSPNAWLDYVERRSVAGLGDDDEGGNGFDWEALAATGLQVGGQLASTILRPGVATPAVPTATPTARPPTAARPPVAPSKTNTLLLLGGLALAAIVLLGRK